MTEYRWVSPRKMRQYHVDRIVEDFEEAEKRLYFAVISGEVRARLDHHRPVVSAISARRGHRSLAGWWHSCCTAASDGVHPFDRTGSWLR
jgi:hypothetical protein